jgi:hypothetical protein
MLWNFTKQIWKVWQLICILLYRIFRSCTCQSQQLLTSRQKRTPDVQTGCAVVLKWYGIGIPQAGGTVNQNFWRVSWLSFHIKTYFYARWFSICWGVRTPAHLVSNPISPSPSSHIGLEGCVMAWFYAFKGTRERRWSPRQVYNSTVA